MPDLFISYAREDRETAQALAEVLQQAGVAVWWDRALTGGGDFAGEIEQNLIAALVVIVLWSPASVRSEFVRDESSRARDLKKLLPVRIAPVELPLGFGTLHTLDLLEWDGDADHEACATLIEQVQQRLVRAREPGGAAADGAVPRPLPATGAEDTLGHRRRRRRLLGGLGIAAAAGVAGAGWLGWSDWQARRREADAQRRSEEHFRQAIGDQFAQPPQLERAAFEYNQAVLLDPGMAAAHYYLAHLYAQMMLRGTPPPSGEVLEALRSDARTQFELALAHSDRLDGSQRVIAKAQFALLDQRDEAAPLTRPATPAAADDAGGGATGGAASASVPSPPPPPPTTRPTIAAATGTPVDTSPGSGQGSGSGATSPGRPVAVHPVRPPLASGTAAAASAIGPTTTAASRAVLPRVPAPAAAQEAAQRRGEALFNPDRDSRLATTTALTLDPALAADTLPAAIRSATAALRSAPAADVTQQGLASTLALLERASPSTLRENDGALQALLRTAAAAGGTADASVQRLRGALARSQRSRPVVYIQIADERQRPVAQALIAQLAAAGYTTPAIENTGPARAPDQPAVRSQGASDPDLARWCQRVLSAAVGAPASLSVLRNARATTDTYELWFDKALCAPGGRSAPGCA